MSRFEYLYAFILILILYPHYLYSKFKVLIPLILNNTHDDQQLMINSPRNDMYTKHKLSMIHIWTLQYFVEDCVYLSLFPLFVNAATTKTVNADEWFESLESFISIISIFLNLWIWMTRCMNETYFKCYAFDVNKVFIFIAPCIYKLMLNWVRMNYSHTQNYMSTYE